MNKKKQSNGEQRAAGGYDHIGSDSDFYSASPDGEQPLYQDRQRSSMQHVRKTGRHQAVAGRRKETADPREKAALLAILKSVIMILLLLIAFFLLWKGIKIFEEREFRKVEGQPDIAPVLQEMALVEDFDVENQNARELFAERVGSWKEAARLVRSADALILRNNYDQAISRCQDALRLNPAHIDALERLGELYFMKGKLVESINAYIRLLNVDPSRADVKINLIEVLDRRGDANAVVFMARWYLEENEYDGNIQRYLAHALFTKEEYGDAIDAYRRVLADDPSDSEALEATADAYIALEQYAPALAALEILQEKNYRDQLLYQKMAVCHAQLGQSLETVQTLGKAAHLFGQNTVISWVADPRLDPVRDDRTFQAFAERVGGEEFRKWLEKVAQSMDKGKDAKISPQLKLPDQEGVDPSLLNRK